ncbi:hypothetical protein [Maricaulis sp. CAU 1757]
MSYFWLHHDGVELSELALTGPFSDETLALAFDALAAWPDWSPTRQILVSAEAATGSGSLTVSGFIQYRAFLQAWDTQFRPVSGARTALVMPDPLKHTLAQVWEGLARDQVSVEVNVFRDRRSAVDWLLGERRVDARPPGGHTAALAGQRHIRSAL